MAHPSCERVARRIRIVLPTSYKLPTFSHSRARSGNRWQASVPSTDAGRGLSTVCDDMRSPNIAGAVERSSCYNAGRQAG